MASWTVRHHPITVDVGQLGGLLVGADGIAVVELTLAVAQQSRQCRLLRFGHAVTGASETDVRHPSLPRCALIQHASHQACGRLPGVSENNPAARSASWPGATANT